MKEQNEGTRGVKGDRRIAEENFGDTYFIMYLPRLKISVLVSIRVG